MTDADGKAVTGSKSMVFAIYTAKTGGTAVLSETESVTIDSNGVYNVELDVSSLDFNEPYWLGINVEGEGDLSATAKELARKVIDRVKK